MDRNAWDNVVNNVFRDDFRFDEYDAMVLLQFKEPIFVLVKEIGSTTEPFEKQVERCEQTLQRKKKEYTGDSQDRLSAFKVAAAMQGCKPERALAGMMAKHIVSLYDMCYADRETFDMTTWDEKITDSLNYLFLLKAIVEEGQNVG